MRPLVDKGRGGGIATDRIMVDGEKIGYMVREAPADRVDSGWAFFAGDETDEYLSDTDNVGVYQLNTIANFTPDIVPLLDAPVGSAYERNPTSGRLELVAK
ncbi:MAG: DUF2185 domain-containing protein [Myxococcota bacterium]